MSEKTELAHAIVGTGIAATGQSAGQLAEGGQGTSAIASRIMKAAEKSDQLAEEGKAAQAARTGGDPELRHQVEEVVRDTIIGEGKSPAGKAGNTVKQIVEAGLERLGRKSDDKIAEGVGSLEDAAGKVIEEGRKELTQRELDQTGALDRKNAAAKAMNIADRLRDSRPTPASEEAVWMVKEKLKDSS